MEKIFQNRRNLYIANHAENYVYNVLYLYHIIVSLVSYFLIFHALYVSTFRYTYVYECQNVLYTHIKYLCVYILIYLYNFILYSRNRQIKFCSFIVNNIDTRMKFENESWASNPLSFQFDCLYVYIIPLRASMDLPLSNLDWNLNLI